jgi:hypothetical protein
MAHGQWTEVEARSVLDALKRSGLSIEKFARSRGLTPQRLYWWKKKLCIRATTGLQATTRSIGALSRIPVWTRMTGRAAHPQCSRCELTKAQHALRRQHGGRPPRLRVARHHRHLPRRRRARAGLPRMAFERLGTHRDIFDLSLDEMTPPAFKIAAGS